MMKFKQYIAEQTLDKKRWDDYVKTNKMLGAGVDLLKELERLGGEAYIVGGAVRDIVLGDEPHDIDIATNIPVKKIESHFRTHDIGASKDFGIVTIKHKNEDFEVAQFRTDGTYSDGRKPDDVKIVMDFKSDAERRDLTINAMGIDKEGNIIDHFAGQKAIKDKIIKMVGNPSKRLEEDKLRMMRVVRFAAKLDFKVDSSTKKALAKFAGDIKQISPERVRDELIKTAGYGGKQFATAIRMLDEVGILQHILPEISKMKEFEHHKEYHPEGGVFDHTMAALEASKSKNPIVNLGILLHDVGKTITRTYKKDGDITKVQYLKHAYKGVDLIDDIAKRLKLSNKEKAAVEFATANHMRFHDLLKMSNSKIHKLIQDDNFDVLVDVAYADAASRGKLHDEKDWQKVIDKIQHVKDNMKPSEYEELRKLLSGHKIMQLLNIKPGKELGAIIKDTMEYAVDNSVKDADTLYKYITDKYKGK